MSFFFLFLSSVNLIIAVPLFLKASASQAPRKTFITFTLIFQGINKDDYIHSCTHMLDTQSSPWSRTHRFALPKTPIWISSVGSPNLLRLTWWQMKSLTWVIFYVFYSYFSSLKARDSLYAVAAQENPPLLRMVGMQLSVVLSVQGSVCACATSPLSNPSPFRPYSCSHLPAWRWEHIRLDKSKHIDLDNKPDIIYVALN